MKSDKSSCAVADFDTPPNTPDAPMTGDQADLLRALCTEAGVPFNENLTQIEAHRRIKDISIHLNTDPNL